MSYIFSRALVEASSLAICLDTDACVPSNASRTRRVSLWHDKTMDPSRLSRYGMTCAPLTEDLGAALLTSSLAASRAQTSAPPGKALGSKAPAARCGDKWRGSFTRYDPPSSSWRTHQRSLVEDSEPFSETWPRWGLMRDGECWELDMSGLRMVGNAYGSLPTPSGTSNHGKNHVCGRLDEWGGSSNPWRGTETGKVSSPAFEEWVMGWPVQWTELTASATGRCREWRSQHGSC